MQKITIKELVEFRRKSDKSKMNFAFKLKTRTEKNKVDTENEGGGDYWVTSTSSIYNTFKHDKDEFYDDKIEELHLRYSTTEDLRVKDMYRRNIEILENFKDFDFKDLRPRDISKFETVHKDSKILILNNFPIYLNPSLIFCFERNGKDEIGALWLVPQLEGFQKSELGMFCEILHRFLIKNYSANYQISEDYCIAVDTFNAQTVIYSDLVNGQIPFLIDKTLEEVKNI
ncbi:hypothetical protein [Flavobacterium sp.]|uniref:hypothetical protein n=1 Tax=Flavobacterium sp. TaxID=239 RepID=UPI0028BDC003|nr:hypothetical protein [Flavobacterium sp.]